MAQIRKENCLLTRICGSPSVFWACMAGVFEAFQGKRMVQEFGLPKGTLTEQAVRGKRGFLPALTWLSLAGLLASRARLRFTRQKPAYSMIENCPALPYTTSGGNLLFALLMPEKTHSRLPKPDQSPTNSGEEPDNSKDSKVPGMSGTFSVWLLRRICGSKLDQLGKAGFSEAWEDKSKDWANGDRRLYFKGKRTSIFSNQGTLRILRSYYLTSIYGDNKQGSGSNPNTIMPVLFPKKLCRGKRGKLWRRERDYLLRNASAGHLNYGLARPQKLPNGSGIIESTVRRVLNLRMKGASIYWTKDHAEDMILLRAYYKSGYWQVLENKAFEYSYDLAA